MPNYMLFSSDQAFKAILMFFLLFFSFCWPCQHIRIISPKRQKNNKKKSVSGASVAIFFFTYYKLPRHADFRFFRKYPCGSFTYGMIMIRTSCSFRCFYSLYFSIVFRNICGFSIQFVLRVFLVQFLFLFILIQYNSFLSDVFEATKINNK